MTATGCQFHKTGQGFRLRSQWALEYDGTDEAVAQGADKTPDGLAASPVYKSKPGPAKPEVLSWRTRLKNQLAAARLARQEETRRQKALENATTLATINAGRLQIPPPAAPPAARVASAKSAAEQPPSGSIRPISLEIPDSTSSLPETRRPDLVLD
jgi:hypothetical protein